MLGLHAFDGAEVTGIGAVSLILNLIVPICLLSEVGHGHKFRKGFVHPGKPFFREVGRLKLVSDRNTLLGF